jgi:hypothetical protein
MTTLKRLIYTLHKTSQFYVIVLHKFMKFNVKWNSEKIKTDEIKICVMFECEWSS